MKRVPAIILVLLALACGQDGWPDAPPVDDAQYRNAYEQWLDERQQTAEFAMRITGIWPLPEGETAFGADESLPVVLPARVAPGRAGTFRRAGNTVTVVPAPGAPLLADGSLVISEAEVHGPLELGTISLEVVSMGDPSEGRLYVSAWDAQHPEAQDLPPVETYPVDSRWRLAARFDAFDSPRPVRVPDVRGGEMRFDATGELVFRVGDAERRLTAFGEPGSDQLFVMFKDETNRSTTYGGYRILTPRAVAGGEWTVLDFNLAFNPPCAYSRFTTCPLPPRENRLDAAIEAGEKRYPAGQGFAG